MYFTFYNEETYIFIFLSPECKPYFVFCVDFTKITVIKKKLEFCLTHYFCFLVHKIVYKIVILTFL